MMRLVTTVAAIHTHRMTMYEKLTDLNVLYEAFNKSKQGVDWKCSIQKYESNILAELMRLRKRLIEGTYKQKPFYEFDIHERGKHRHIKSLHISDRVLQRALCDEILTPVLGRYLIYDNGASQKGKGIEFTRERLRAHLQKYYRKYGNKGYILLIDFRKYFDSVPHDKVLEAVGKHIQDENVMQLVRDMTESFGEERSLGIGSQISQVFGIFYPTRIDNYCKIVRGCKYYGRYMDDLYIIHHDKAFLKELLVEIRKISEDMGLSISEHKTQICRIDKGFIFLKLYHFITPTGKVVRKPCKKNLVRERRKLKKLKTKGVPERDILESYKSWRGNMLKYQAKRAVGNMDRLVEELFHAERDYFESAGGQGDHRGALLCSDRKCDQFQVQLHRSDK